MGLYDRDYYRDEGDGSWSEWLDQRGAIVIIAVTCAVFFLQLLTVPKSDPATAEESRKQPVEQQRFERYDPVRRSADLYPPAIVKGEVWRMLTGFWVHDLRQVISFLFGMIIIYMIGRQLETIIGGKELLVVYLVAGLATMLLLFIGKLLSRYAFAGVALWPFDFESAACGSAGPVAAVVMLFALKFWDQPLRLFGESTMPTWGFVGLFFGLSFVLKLALPERAELIATELFGILAAWTYHKAGWRLSESIQLPGGSASDRQRTRLKLVPAPDDADDEHTDSDPVEPVIMRTTKRAEAVDEQLEAKLDRVLDKVSRSGRDSLTADEQSILLRASEVYKRRRGH